MKETSDLTVTRVRELLDYHRETGLLMWRVRAATRIQVGDVAGNVSGDGYLRVRISGTLYQAHRLVWLHVHGVWPADDLVIDHINGQRADNRLENLRVVTHIVNMQNQRRARRGTRSGLLGVRRARQQLEGWWATIKVDGKHRHLGTFRTPQEAHKAYLSAKRALHEGCTL